MVIPARSTAASIVASKKFREYFFISIRALHLLFCLINILELLAIFRKSFYFPCPILSISCVSNFLCACHNYSKKKPRTEPPSLKLLFINFYWQAVVVISIMLSLSAKLSQQRVGYEIEVLKMGIVALILFHIAIPVSVIAAVQAYERMHKISTENTESIDELAKNKRAECQE